MLNLFSIKKDLRVYIAGCDRPKKYTWMELGEYLAQEAYAFGKADINYMKNRHQALILNYFLKAPIGTRMLSTAFYLFIHFKTVSKILQKGDESKNRQDLLTGFESGLTNITATDENTSAFSQKHIHFILRYLDFLMEKSRRPEFQPGKIYASSLYNFYKMPLSQDPDLKDECKETAFYMNKRFIECNKRISKRITIKTL